MLGIALRMAASSFSNGNRTGPHPGFFELRRDSGNSGRDPPVRLSRVLAEVREAYLDLMPRRISFHHAAIGPYLIRLRDSGP